VAGARQSCEVARRGIGHGLRALVALPAHVPPVAGVRGRFVRSKNGRMRSPLPLAALAVPLLLGALCPSPYASHPAVRVALDPATRFQTMEGIGGSAANEADLRRMPEPDRSEVLDLVFGDLEPSVVRLKVWPAIEPANDDADPATVNAAGFVAPDDTLWQDAEIFARGNPKRIAAMWTPPAWMKTTHQECCGGTLKTGYDAELAELFSVWLGYLRDAGHPLDSLSIQNEPEAASPWDANVYTPPRMATVLEAVAQRLGADGHATRLHGPDNAVANFVQIFLPYLLAQPTARARMDAIGFHLYGATTYWDPASAAPDVAAVAAVTPDDLPLWMTEFSNTTSEGYGSHDEGVWQAELMHDSFQGGVSLYAMWNLYRPGGPGEAAIVIPTQPGVAGYTITPKYWTLRQFTKFVKPGAQLVAASDDSDDVLVSAFRDDAAGTLVAVAINRADAPRWAVFDGGVLDGPPRVIRSAPGEYGVEVAPESADRFAWRSHLLPARSVTTLVWPLSE
jgi:O-glycosyl hydrolase